MTDIKEAWNVEGALALGDNLPVGRYRFDLAAESWWWSDETYRIHGFEPGDVVPTTELILAHKHPDDRARVSEVLTRACTTGEAFSSVHRIMNARGEERTLAVVGEGRRDHAGTVCELVGYFTDVTPAVNRVGDARATAAIQASAANRATIEQAKVLIAFHLAIETEDAFALLREASNRSNVPLRALAHTLVAESTGPGRDPERLGEIVRRMCPGS
ncbi:MAG TPA: PAS and ANTAR domain-containing protein [Isoptericola sp.]|nr:PAS and ANTAR domain-containing protein [Isoptericola sp.]